MKKNGGIALIKTPSVVVKEVVDEIEPLVDELIVAVETGRRKPDIASYLRMLVDVAAWKQCVKERTQIQGSLYVPAVLKSIAKMAEAGDITAARLLFEYLELLPRKGSGVNVLTQVNLSPQELEEIRQEINGKEI